MADFPALPAPASEGVTPLSIEAFLEALDGPPHQGRGDLAELRPRLLTIDVRSPAEFEVGHIPGAVNVPLFDNEARAVVGTDFKRKGRYEAIHTGLELAGPKFASFLDAVQDHGAKPGSRLLVYCWRGGMRSGSMAWLFSLCGFQVNTLQGGYRSYRRWCKTVVGDANVAPPAPVLVLGGCTGVGKTAILHELRAADQQILDLEGLAKHRGSAFGAMTEPQPSNEAFENILAFAVRRVRPQKPLWIEHEGRHVGKAGLPFGVLAWVTNATGGALVMLSMSQELRVRRLVDDYAGNGCAEQLKTCVSVLSKRLGGQRVKDAHRLLDEGQWSEVASMMLDYYDKLYEKWAAESQASQRIEVKCPTVEAADNARRVLTAVQDLKFDEPMDFAPPPRESGPTPSSETKEAPEVRFEGQCHCGEVKILCYDDARAVSYCHCSICRRLSGAPFSCQALFNADKVELTLEPGATLTSLQTSRGVERARCASCMAPVRGLVLGGKVAAIPLALLSTWRDGDSALRPMHHLYYANRVMDLRDGLPKYVGPLRSPLLPQSEW